MVTKSPTPILLDTSVLSQIVSDVLSTVEAPASKKSACLNRVAARIAGPKHNWGFLTGRDAPVVARGVEGFDVIKAPGFATRDSDSPSAPLPLPPAIAEFVQATARQPLPELDPLPALPSMESLNKADEIMKAAQPRNDAIREARLISSTYQPDPLRIEFSAGDLLDFMDKDKKFSRRVIAYMQANIKAVQEDLDTQAVTPVYWQDAARIAQLFEDSVVQDSEMQQQELFFLLRTFAKLFLGRHAGDFCDLMKAR